LDFKKYKGDIIMRIGLIRCMKTEDICAATKDFMVIKNKKGAFKGIKEEIEVMGVTNCGGCPFIYIWVCQHPLFL